MAKPIQIPKSEDISKIIQRIKNAKDREIIFDVETGSAILKNSGHLRLMRKTGEVLGKKVILKTDDEVGKVLALKAEMELFGNEQVSMPSGKKLNRAGESGMTDMRGKRSVRKNVPAKSVASSAAGLGVVSGMASAAKNLVSKPMAAAKAVTASVPQSPRIFGMSRELSKYLILGVVVLLIVVFSVVVLMPQAQITVYARSEPITRDVEISVDRNALTPDSSRLIIPGELITREQSHTKTFPTTGIKLIGEQATGSVVIYNFTTTTLTLRAATTTLIINGRNYFFTRDATGIRPTATIGSGDDQQIDRSSLTEPIPIIAEDPGGEYNLSANQKFELVNTALGPNPDVYAMNEVAITGGSSESISILSQADVDRATGLITEELVKLVEDDLRTTSAESTVKLIPTGSNQEVLAKTANVEVEAEATEFDMTVIGRVTALAYDELQIESLIQEQIKSVLTPDKYLVEESGSSISANFKSIDLEAGRGVLSVHYETTVAYRVNDNDLSQTLSGKSATEIKEILLSKPEVDRVDIKFSPFFVTKAPRFNGKIYIKTVLSQL